jgi:Asparagine synthase (glutamine-hydrolyzing)
LQNLLKDAVERQISDLNSSETVGVFLSGGLDSSVVAALLVKAGVKVRAYTLDFGEAGIPEYPWAEQVAYSLKIPLVKVDARPHRIKQVLHSAVKALDLPFGDGVTVPLYLLNEAASQETDLVFNGEGGDQLFAGWTNKPLIAAGIYQAQIQPETKLLPCNTCELFTGCGDTKLKFTSRKFTLKFRICTLKIGC